MRPYAELERDALSAAAKKLTASDAYRRGWADGMAGRDPDFESLALGANRLNDYERGYIDSGREPASVTPPGGDHV